MKKLTLLAITLTVAALAFSACSLIAVGGGEEIIVTARETANGMSFEPAVITVEAGAEVTFVIKNAGTVDHEFESIEAGEAGIEEIIIPPGRSRRVSWTAPDEAGSFPVYCDLPGHRAAGMELTLEVTPRDDAK